MRRIGTRKFSTAEKTEEGERGRTCLNWLGTIHGVLHHKPPRIHLCPAKSFTQDQEFLG
jgi:hypothetical protein